MTSSSRRPWRHVDAERVAIAALWLAAIALLVVWLTRTTTELLRDQLRHLHFWSLEPQLALAATAFVACSRDLVSALAVPRHGWLVPLAASGLAVLLAGGVAPRTSRIYYDEQIYQSVGRNLSDLRLAQMCNEGTVEYGILQCQRGEYNKQPYGYPHLLGMAYRVAGVHERVAHDLNVAAAGLLVWVVFLTTTVWFRDWLAGSLAALIAALIPQQLLWANTAASEPTAVLTASIAVLAAVHFTRVNSTWALLWTTVATSLAVQFRTESILVVPVVLLAIALGRPEERRRTRFWWAGLLGLILCAPHLAHFAAMSVFRRMGP